MLRSTLASYVEQRLTIRRIAAAEAVSATTVRYWLKKHNFSTWLSPRPGQRASEEVRCPCGETDREKFYGKDTRICGACRNRKTMEQGWLTRAWILKEMGDKCSVHDCGYHKHPCGLDLHHIDPAEKDSSFRSIRSWCRERIKKELKKCVLVCKNCHAAIHAGLIPCPPHQSSRSSKDEQLATNE
jgi:hypothetical protein